MAKANPFDKRFPGSAYSRGARWEILSFAPGLSPDQKADGYGQLDERAACTWEAVWTTAGMVTKTPGVGQAYLRVHRDRDDNALDGAKPYRRHVLPHPPAQGHEANSLITVPGRAWFPLLRLYAPLQPYFDRTWPLPDIETAK